LLILADLPTPLRLAFGWPKVFPIADVLTMLEVPRRFELSPQCARGYAAEILLAVCHGINTNIQPQIAHGEESHNAVA
jgi:hypothetical protein